MKNGGNIKAVLALSETECGPFVVPIWNSHQGEVEAAEDVWNKIEKAEIKISDAWGKRIGFSYVARLGGNSRYLKIGSVVVAASQCSVFLNRIGAELVQCELTTVAFEAYKNGEPWDGVLVAGLQDGDDDDYEIVEQDVANPNNFTSFVRFSPARENHAASDSDCIWLTGVSMGVFQFGLKEAEQAFFDRVLGSAKHVRELPKLIFVFKRPSRVGLLFEGERLLQSDLLDAEELLDDEISVFEEAGALRRQYSVEIEELLRKEFPVLLGEDFVLHKGENTCMFACPPLGIFTHGYDAQTVEPVVKHFIWRIFQLRAEGLECTPEQEGFFEKYMTRWMAADLGFIQFAVVN